MLSVLRILQSFNDSGNMYQEILAELSFNKFIYYMFICLFLHSFIHLLVYSLSIYFIHLLTAGTPFYSSLLYINA